MSGKLEWVPKRMRNGQIIWLGRYPPPRPWWLHPYVIALILTGALASGLVVGAHLFLGR